MASSAFCSRTWAENSYRRQLELDPDSAGARIALAVLTLPIAPPDTSSTACAAGNFSGALDELSCWLETAPAHQASFASAIGTQQPFYLAYRDGNHAGLLARYGDLVAQSVLLPSPPASFTSPHDSGKIRLVVISNQIRRHSVWDIVLKGLLTHLDRNRFEVILYHTGLHEDAETALARTMVDGWRDRRRLPHFDNLLAAIQADCPDVILYPKIGMDPFSFRLAAHRLAHLQIASWGHPISSGLPTIDLFLSGQLLKGMTLTRTIASAWCACRAPAAVRRP